MGISITEGKEELKYFLNRFDLTENMSYVKIAYVENIVLSETSEGKKFYRFSLRDTDCRIVVARMFNVDNLEETGSIVSDMKKSLVKIDFDTDLWKNEITLNIRKIDTIDKEQLSADVYFKPLEGIEDCKNRIKKSVDDLADEYNLIKKIIYTNNLLDVVFNGYCDIWLERVGGSALIVDKMLKVIDSFGFDKKTKDRLVCLYIVSSVFKCKNDSDVVKSMNDVFDLGLGSLTIIKKNEEFWKIYKGKSVSEVIVSNEFSDNLALEGVHVFSCMMGIKSPATYSAKFIINQLELLLNLENLYVVNKGMIDNSDKVVNNDRIVKLN